MTNHTPESLIAFRDRVAAAFLEKRIASPIHLPGGNESQLIEIFREVRRTDYVFSNWRSMYHALLHGIPEEALFDMILSGRSMYVMSRKHRFLASSIVGGILPIACGTAMGIKRMRGDERVFVFVGDMTACTGLFHEFRQYVQCQNLPVATVVEDNGLSTDTPTGDAWGREEMNTLMPRRNRMQVYSYQRTTNHVGVGVHVEF